MHPLIFLPVVLLFSALPARADCTDEVAAALERQRKSSAYRTTTSTVTEKGPVTMTVDYILPDRMHQTVKAMLEPGEVERILIGGQAWIKVPGAKWERLPQAAMNELRDQMRDNIVDAPARLAAYECLGKVTVDNEELIGYRLDDRTVLPTGKKIAPPEGTPERVLYVHPITGLPVREIAAPRGRPEKPFHKTIFTYSQDITIDAPPAGN